MKTEIPILSKSQQKKAARKAVIREQEMKTKIAKSWHAWLLIGFAAVVAALIFYPFGQVVGQKLAAIPPKDIPVPPTLNVVPQDHPSENTLDLGQLLALSRNQLQGIDIAILNLACSKDLPGCEKIDIPATRRLLDQWAAHVRSETIRNHHLFTDHPERYANSESYFKAVMMVVVLQEDMGIHYNLERMKDADFTHGEDVLMNGLIGPLREGTCSSMPVLYVAVGRRLDYPLYLVATRGHCFCRWESTDGKVRFNIEGTSRGVNAYSDNFYRQWPYKLTDDEMWSGAYLRNMVGMEEFACFLMERGNILEALGRMPEAELAYAEAHSIIPDHFLFFGNLAVGVHKEKMMRSGLLDPSNPANPYRGKIPPPYGDEPPANIEVKTVHDEGAKQ